MQTDNDFAEKNDTFTESMNESASPKVSVIIPVYNAERYLEQCLSSVITQTLTDIEIICIDDGSTDSSLSILNDFKDKDSRITVIEKVHSNAGDARNEGLDAATGEYLAFVDADDYVEPYMLERAYCAASELSADIVHFRCNMWDEAAKEYRDCPWTLRDWEMPPFRPFAANEAAEKIFNMGSCTPWDKLFNAEFIRKNNITFQSITTCDDMLFTYSAIAVAECITTLDDLLYHQRVGYDKHLADHIENTITNYYLALTQLKRFLIERDIYDIYKKSFLNWAADFSIWFYNVFRMPFFHNYIGQKLINEHFPALGVYELAEEDYYNHDLFEQVAEMQVKHHEFSDKLLRHSPVVSVIVPVFNADENIQKCLEQVVNQTFTDVEIILVNEKDDPASIQLSEKLRSIDPRIITITNDGVASYASALNAGIAASHGTYFTIVEPFDLIDVKMIEILYDRARQHDLDVVKGDIAKLKHDEFGNAVLLPRNTAQSEENYNIVIDSSYDRRWRHFYKSHLCALYKKEFIERNIISFSETEDSPYIDEEFIFNVNITARRAMYVSDVLYFDRVKSLIFSGYSMIDLLS